MEEKFSDKPLILRPFLKFKLSAPNPSFLIFILVNSSFLILVRFKSDENNILQLAIHLFSNQSIYYRLFD